jgi:glutamate synthase (ferredoxin)
MNNMRNRVVLETDGKLLTGRDIIIAALLGAEEFAFATGPLVVMGCDMMRVCNLDTCPVGIATQNPTLCSKFEGKPEHVENFMLFLAEEVREWMARIGVTDFNELIGHAELLRQIITEKDKAYTVVLDRLLYQPKIFDTEGSRYFTKPQDHALEQSIDMKTLIPLCREAIENPGEKAAYRFEIKNTDRTVGATLSSAIAKKHGAVGLPEGSIHIRFDGSSGQSFGSFLAPGVELELHGDANDYLGKGLSGGRITIVPPDEATFTPSENVIAGNTALYGATMGECYIAGKAGERFAVRNSGATAVVEGVGDHGCEYMTGGRVVILGRTGINFGAGMSGGIAYVLDEEGIFTSRCSGEKLTLGGIDKEGKKELKALLEAHVKYTDSAKGRAILGDFEKYIKKFVRVIPNDYQKVLDALAQAKKKGIALADRPLYAFNVITGQDQGHAKEVV